MIPPMYKNFHILQENQTYWKEYHLKENKINNCQQEKNKTPESDQ